MKVHLASNLYRYTNERREVDAEGATLRALLDDLERQYPGIRFRVVDEQDRIRPHIRMFVGQTIAPTLATKLSGDEEVHILAALSGG